MTLMPFGDNFKWNDLSTYTWEEYSILGAVLFLLVILLLIPVLRKNKKNKKNKVNHHHIENEYKIVSKKSNHKKLVDLTTNDFSDGNGNSLLFQDDNAWVIQPDGKTELFKAVQGINVKLIGKVVYGTPEVKKTLVTQEGEQFVKTSAIERNYITLDFISADEVKFGNVLYANQVELARRNENLRLLQEKEAKEMKIKLSKEKKAENKKNK